MIMIKKEPDLTNFSPNAAESNCAQTQNQIPLGIEPTSKQRLCGDIGMHIDRHGTWYYHGSPIKRKELVKLFSKVLQRDREGNHWLITPAEIAHVRVDDAAHVVVDMDIDGTGSCQVIRFRTMVDITYDLSKSYPLHVKMDPRTKEPAPYLLLDHGLEAKLNRSTFFDLANLAIVEDVDGEHMLGVWSCDVFHIIGKPTED